MAVTLYQFEISPFCDKVRRMLNLKGVPFAVHEVRFAEIGKLKRTVSPTGKFPALDLDGRIVVDSTDIAEALDAAYPTPRLIPADPREKALAHVIEDWADESLYFYEMTMRFAWPENAKRWTPELLKAETGVMKSIGAAMVGPALRRVVKAQGVGRKAKAQVVAEVRRHVAAVEGLLDGGDWLAGDSISVADLSVFAQLFCIGGTPEGAAAIAASKPVSDWMSRVDAASGTRAAPSAAA